MDIKNLSKVISMYVANYSHQFFNSLNEDKANADLCKAYLKEVNQLHSEFKTNKEQYYDSIRSLIQTKKKEDIYFVICDLIYHADDEKKVKELLESIDKEHLDSKLTIKQLKPFRLYALTSLSVIQNTDKSKDHNDIYYKNKNFHSVEDMYQFLVYHYLGSPYLSMDSRVNCANNAVNTIKHLPQELKNVLLLNMLVHYATHKATKKYVDLTKLFFNTHQAEYDLGGQHFKDLYYMMCDSLIDINQPKAASYIRQALEVAFSRYTKSNKHYSQLHKDLTFLGEDDQTIYDIEDRLNTDCPKLVSDITSYIRKICKKNEYLSNIDEESDKLVKKLLPMLNEFSGKNFSICFEIVFILDKALKKDEALFDVTVNKIKDLRSYESLSLCVILNLIDNDSQACYSYLDKFITYDVSLRPELDKLAFNYAKFLKYYLVTKDFEKDTGLLVTTKDLGTYSYSDKSFESVSDFTNYIYNRSLLLKGLNKNVNNNKLYEAIYVVNNLFLYFLFNKSLDSCLRINFDVYQNYNVLRNSLDQVNFTDVKTVLDPILITTEKEIEKNKKRINLDLGLNLEQIFDQAQFTKLYRIQEKLLKLYTIEQYQNKLNEFAKKNNLIK